MKIIKKPKDIIAIAQKVIKSTIDIELLSIFQFENDEDAHDDKFQDQIHDEYNAIFQELLKDLEKEYGQPVVAKKEDEFNEIPLCGVFPAAIWKLNNGHLYLAVSHEDRETPVLLIIGYK